MKSFFFELNEKVCLKTNPNESGRVIGRAEYTEANNSYLIRYKAADGRSVEQWWSENALQLDDSDKAGAGA